MECFLNLKNLYLMHTSVCLCVCVCVCLFVCVCVHRCAYVPMFMSMCLEHILVYACAGVCICTCFDRYTFVDVLTCVCVCTGWLESTLRVIIICVPLTIRFEKTTNKQIKFLI